MEGKSEEITLTRQCELLSLPRSSFYYEARYDDSFNLEVMKEIDKIYTRHPYYGKRRISYELKKRGYNVGRDLARTLMCRMGIEAIYPRKSLSVKSLGHKIHPYLLRGVKVIKRDHVWSSDITYIPMSAGFLYLTAVIDWGCRYILSWRLSNSLDGLFCREALEEALSKGKPEIFNTDQGAQYTSNIFIEMLENKKIRISMDGRGRALDNIFIERFWRTIKQEEVYIKDYTDGKVAYEGIKKYIRFYNKERPHSALGYKTPEEAYKKMTNTSYEW